MLRMHRQVSWYHPFLRTPAHTPPRLLYPGERGADATVLYMIQPFYPLLRERRAAIKTNRFVERIKKKRVSIDHPQDQFLVKKSNALCKKRKRRA